jgi:hypothetical protein
MFLSPLIAAAIERRSQAAFVLSTVLFHAPTARANIDARI